MEKLVYGITIASGREPLREFMHETVHEDFAGMGDRWGGGGGLFRGFSGKWACAAATAGGGWETPIRTAGPRAAAD